MTHDIKAEALRRFRDQGVRLDPAGIPQELRERQRWMGWKATPEVRGDGSVRIGKPPCCPRTGNKVSKTDPANWLSLEDVLRGILTGTIDGAGFVPGDGIVAVDIDNALDPEGRWKPWAARIVEDLDAFTEVSPSGTGLHVWIQGELPQGAPTSIGHADGKVEIFRAGSFVTVTGVPPAELDFGVDVAPRQEALEALLERLRPGWREPEGGTGRPQEDGEPDAAMPTWMLDLALLERSFKWKRKTPVADLWAGKWDAYPSRSEADQALCNHLAWLFGKDPRRIDRAFRKSELMREKWDAPNGSGTYGSRTIDKAVAGTRTVYTPRPTVRIVKGSIDKAATDLENALVSRQPEARESHQVFQRAGMLVRISREVETGCDGKKIHGVARLSPVLPVNLLDIACAHMAFEKFDKRSDEFVPCDPPEKLLQVVCCRGMWDGFHPLKALVQAPVLTADGRVVSRPGYDELSGIFNTSNLRAQVPDAPTMEDAKAALSSLWDLIQHFPFVEPEDKSAALALLLTAVQRPVLPFAPLFVVTAPTRGSGKSELVDVAVALATGKRCPVLGFTADPEEFRKSLGAKLMTGPAAVSIDNVNGIIKSDELCQAVSQETVECRILGRSENAVIPNTALLVANGNNCSVAEDLTRRVLPIRLDPQCERPEERVFPFSPVDRVKEHRAAYVSAALTLLKAYHVAGKPDMGLTPWAGFDAWSGTIRGALVWAGCPDPCIGRATVMDDDPATALLRRFLAAWHAEFASTGRTLREAVARSKDEDKHGLGVVLEEIAGERGQVNNVRLAKWAQRNMGRVLGGMKLTKGDVFGNAQQWAVHIVRI